MNICPKFLLIKVPALPALSNFHQTAIRQQIKLNSAKLKKLKHESNSLSDFLCSKLSWLEWFAVKTKLNKLRKLALSRLQVAHQNKLA